MRPLTPTPARPWYTTSEWLSVVEHPVTRPAEWDTPHGTGTTPPVRRCKRARKLFDYSAANSDLFLAAAPQELWFEQLAAVCCGGWLSCAGPACIAAPGPYPTLRSCESVTAEHRIRCTPGPASVERPVDLACSPQRYTPAHPRAPPPLGNVMQHRHMGLAVLYVCAIGHPRHLRPTAEAHPSRFVSPSQRQSCRRCGAD